MFPYKQYYCISIRHVALEDITILLRCNVCNHVSLPYIVGYTSPNIPVIPVTGIILLGIHKGF